MKKIVLTCILVCFAIFTIGCKKNTTAIVIETSLGPIHIALYDADSPETVKNFLRYSDEKFYDGTIFHRTIHNFMIQGGGLDADMNEKPTHDPIKNEADNGLSNKRGTVAMARQSMPHSATAQFFINTKDNPSLDHGERDFGYCVFGHVTQGMDIVDKISMIETTSKGMHQDVPLENIVITAIKRVKK